MPVIGVLVVVAAYLLWVSGVPNPLVREKLPKKPLGDFIPGDRIIIIGLPLSGKTYLAAKLTANVPRILYFDPYHDYNEAAGAEEISADSLIENPRVLAKGSFRYAIIPDEDDIAMQLEEVVSIARAAGNLVLVMDEVGDYKRNAQLVLEKLARNGRHNGLVPIYVSQVAMDIPRTVRRIATRVYSFRQEDIEDLDALSERYGEKYAEDVSNLALHRYALWTLTNFGPSTRNPNLDPQRGQSAPKAPLTKRPPSSGDGYESGA
jgi:adenylate kinase family enzyme